MIVVLTCMDILAAVIKRAFEALLGGLFADDIYDDTMVSEHYCCT